MAEHKTMAEHETEHKTMAAHKTEHKTMAEHNTQTLMESSFSMAMAAYECTTLNSELSMVTSSGNTASKVSLGKSDLCVCVSVCVRVCMCKCV